MAEIVALNRTLDADAERAITEIFTEGIIRGRTDREREKHASPSHREENTAAVAGGRYARSTPRKGLTAKPVPAVIGPEPRKRRGFERHDAEGCDQARATVIELARSPIRVPRRHAGQNPTPSFMPRIRHPSGSAPGAERVDSGAHRRDRRRTVPDELKCRPR